MGSWAGCGYTSRIIFIVFFSSFFSFLLFHKNRCPWDLGCNKFGWDPGPRTQDPLTLWMDPRRFFRLGLVFQGPTVRHATTSATPRFYAMRCDATRRAAMRCAALQCDTARLLTMWSNCLDAWMPGYPDARMPGCPAPRMLTKQQQQGVENVLHRAWSSMQATSAISETTATSCFLTLAMHSPSCLMSYNTCDRYVR